MKQRVGDQGGIVMKSSGRVDRLEVPQGGGFRHGVKACTLIGRKLGTMFEVPHDKSDAIDSLLRELDRKICG